MPVSKSFIADFHLHSRYSRATSKDMEVTTLAGWAERKGITLLGTGDFTHPLYFTELKSKLTATGNGLYRLKNSSSPVQFILTVEVNNIFHYRGRLRKIHTLIFAPSLEVVDRINQELAGRGNLRSDGRPTFTFAVKELVRIVREISADCFFVPAHAWTPWFSIFGANSGFDTVPECFEEESRYIYAIETGLSSDPPMNWRWSALDRITLLSNSDAHSPSRLGREANVFACQLDYYDIIDTIKRKDPQRLLYTIEFFPEEGKYHYDGHRNCGVWYHPQESLRYKNFCPICKRRLTIGVLHRVEELADRPIQSTPAGPIGFYNLIPLSEIIADVLGLGEQTQTVTSEYERAIKIIGSEFYILLDASEAELERALPTKLAKAILNVRAGKVNITPGYDGVYGKISVLKDSDTSIAQQQMTLF